MGAVGALSSTSRVSPHFTRSPFFTFTSWAHSAGILLACWYHDQPEILARLLIALVVAWLMAWYRIVGALWRGPLVSAILFCAVLASLAKLGMK